MFESQYTSTLSGDNGTCLLTYLMHFPYNMSESQDNSTLSNPQVWWHDPVYIIYLNTNIPESQNTWITIYLNHNIPKPQCTFSLSNAPPLYTWLTIYLNHNIPEPQCTSSLSNASPTIYLNHKIPKSQDISIHCLIYPQQYTRIIVHIYIV